MAVIDLNIPTMDPDYAKRVAIRDKSEYQSLWTTLDSVYDPELPDLTLWDLGVLQNISKTEGGWLIEITLTYSGCPAVGVMKEDIIKALQDAGITEEIKVEVVLSPPWSTDLISPDGRQQIRNLNIAPPVDDETKITCPICNSNNTGVISEFGSTACKALYQCKDCLEPFDYFKQF